MSTDRCDHKLTRINVVSLLHRSFVNSRILNKALAIVQFFCLIDNTEHGPAFILWNRNTNIEQRRFSRKSDRSIVSNRDDQGRISDSMIYPDM